MRTTAISSILVFAWVSTTACGGGGTVYFSGVAADDSGAASSSGGPTAMNDAGPTTGSTGLPPGSTAGNDAGRDAAVADGVAPGRDASGADGAALGNGEGGAVAPASDAGSTQSSSASACGLAQALRGGSGCHFLVGMGNDLANDHNQDGAYTLGTTLDLHYAYLVGLPTKGGWPDWNANGTFVNILTDSAAAHGVTPMFTLYMMAANGDGNFSMTTDDASMALYWQGAKLLFQRLGVFAKPAVVHLEPDFWGYAMQHSADGSAPVPVAAHAPECAGLPDSLSGMAQCLVKLARTYAPKAAIGFHASSWGGTEAQIVQFFKAIHADSADFIATDMLDRDAGCFEAHTDPNCQRNDGPWYWDETNQTSPNFHDHLAWAKAIHDGLNLPIVWWQVPFGVPSATAGGTSGHYRDNRAHYIFSHVDEFIAAGGVAATFGTGAANQTYITTDSGQFQSAVQRYVASPTALP